MDRYAKIRRQILMGMIVAPLLPLVMCLTIGYFSYVGSMEQAAEDSLRRLAEDHAHMIADFLKERRADLEVLLGAVDPAELTTSGELERLFQTLQSASKSYIDLSLIGPDGVQRAYYGPYEIGNRDYTRQPWYTLVLRHGYAVSDVYMGYRQVPHFVVAVSRNMPDGTWVLRATIDQNVFGRLVERLQLGATGEAYIISKTGELQTERRSGGHLLDRDPFPYPSVEQGVALARGDEDGETYYLASIRLNDDAWRLVVRLREDEALASVRHASAVILSVMIAGGGVIIVLAFFLSGRIVADMRRRDEEKEGLERQLLMAARLAELGEMSAGFAHEINNPLQIMKSDLALMEMILSDALRRGGRLSESEGADLSESIGQITLQIERCAGITQRVLKFGRYGEPQRKPLDLRTALPEIAGMVEKKAAVSGIALSVEVQPDTAQVQGDPGELQQVVLNLLNNAVYAVGERHGASGGKVRLRAANRDGKVVVEVADNGSGISAENMERIFTPFFTTKPSGKGTGLGLPVCYGIVDRMGGNLSVHSRVGSGATFRVTLPALSATQAETGEPQDPGTPQGPKGDAAPAGR